jgi:hypothetical protein
MATRRHINMKCCVLEAWVCCVAILPKTKADNRRHEYALLTSPALRVGQLR